jgi:hypothetical protein
MDGRDVPDLLAGLQDALNIAHDNDFRFAFRAIHAPPISFIPSVCRWHPDEATR